MAEPIEANYVPQGDDWTITVAGRGKKLTAKAPGIIAARDRADQLVEELAPNAEFRTVVHLLDGDAVQFTTAYLTARMAKPEPRAAEPAPVAAPDGATDGADGETTKPESASKAPSPRPQQDDSASAPSR